MEASARGHWLPQFHLREFGVESMRVTGVPGRFGQRAGHVWQYDKRVGATGKESIKRAAQSPGHYHIPEAPGLEDALAGIEQAAAPTIRRLLDLPPGRHELDANERVPLAFYLALLYVRTPAHTALMTAMGNAGQLFFADMHVHNHERFAASVRQHEPLRTDEEIEAMRLELIDDLRHGRIRIDTAASSLGISLKVAVEQLYPRFAGMRWLLVRVRQPPWLVLGDQPVIPVGEDDSLVVGLDTPGASTFVPLAPTALMLGQRGFSDGSVRVVIDERPAVSGSVATDANRFTWRSARRYVYAHSRADLDAASLAEDPATVNRRPKYHISGLPPEWRGYVDPDEIELVDEPDLPDNLMHAWIE